MHLKYENQNQNNIHQIGSHENWLSITTYFAFKIFILEIWDACGWYTYYVVVCSMDIKDVTYIIDILKDVFKIFLF